MCWRLAPFLAGYLAGALLYYQLFLLSPSYNWLALNGLLLGVTGVFLHLAGARAWLCALVLGVGGYITFAAKPMSGLLLLALIFVLLAVMGQLRRSWPVLAGATALAAGGVLSHMLLVDGGIAASFAKLQLGRDGVALFSPGRGLAEISWEVADFFVTLPALAWRIFPVLVPVAALCAILAALPVKARIWRFGLRGVLAAVTFAWAWDIWSLNHIRQPYSMHVLMMLPLAAFVVSVPLLARRTPDEGPKWIALVAPALFLMLLPFVYSYGTNNRIAYHTMSAAGFTVAAALVLLEGARARAQQVLGTIAVCTVMTLWGVKAFEAAQAKPYRGGVPASQMTALLEAPAPVGRLSVTPATAQYAADLRAAEGFVPGTPLIDLTGGTPGAAVLLGADIVGVPWLLGGYPGTPEFVAHVFDTVPPETITRAWVLHAPGGRRSIPATLLAPYGMQFPEDYRPAATLRTGHRDEEQTLWAPR